MLVFIREQNQGFGKKRFKKIYLLKKINKREKVEKKIVFYEIIGENKQIRSYILGG